jgi:hypothetical protein
MMAQAALEKADDENVLNFAQQVINTQDAEIETMTQMLNERLAAGGTTTPESGTHGTPAAGTPEAIMSEMPGMASPTATHADN